MGIVKNLRGPKIFDMSIFDWSLSIVGGYLFSKLFLALYSKQDWFVFIFIWILLGITAHLVFNVNSMLGFYLHLNKKPTRG